MDIRIYSICLYFYGHLPTPCTQPENTTATVSFPGGSLVKNPPAGDKNAGDTDSIPGSGRSPGEGNGNPLQYSCLGNPMDRGAAGYSLWGSKRVRHNLVTKQQQTATRVTMQWMQRSWGRGLGQNKGGKEILLWVPFNAF